MKAVSILCALGGLALLLGGCQRQLTPVEQGDRDQTLLLDNGVEPEQLDPQMVTFQTDANIDFALFEGLLSPDPQTLAPIPGVAERWEISADGLTYTFHLRENARWSDGDPVTADDFLYSYRRMLTPSLGAEYASMLFVVKNAEAFHAGKVPFEQVGFAAPDARTFRVTLAQPVPYFLSLVAHQAWFPVQRKTIEKFGRLDDRATRWVLPGNLVGNGPFVLKQWRVNEVVEVEKNPLYWDAAAVRLNRVRFFPIDTADTGERAFRSGQIHVGPVPVPKLPLYRKSYPSYLFIHAELMTEFLKCNVTLPPFDKAEVRRALALAIDRPALIAAVLKGDQIPATHLCPPGLPGYDPGAAAGFHEDVAEARRLLAAAGYPGGKGFPATELMWPGSGAANPLAEAVQQMWKENLGIEIPIVMRESKACYEALQSLRYQITVSGWIGDYLDPTTFLDLLRANNDNNQTGWKDPAYDALLDRAARTLDPVARFALLRQAEAQAIQAMPFIPLFHGVARGLRRPDVHGWYENVLGVHPYKAIWLDPATAGPARLPRP
jgi:oligopeptide transport system substrate-binding protein